MRLLGLENSNTCFVGLIAPVAGQGLMTETGTEDFHRILISRSDLKVSGGVAQPKD